VLVVNPFYRAMKAPTAVKGAATPIKEVLPLMQALSQWLAPRGTTIEVDRDEYTKPDLKERAETWQILNAIRDAEDRPVLSRDEIREKERYSVAVPSETLSSGVLQ
jgi:hypothetical protein